MTGVNQRRRILIVMFANTGCYREVIRGISTYGNTEGRWRLELSPPEVDVLAIIRSYQPDGVLLGAMRDQESQRAVIDLVPRSVAVCRGYFDRETAVPAVEADDAAVGTRGAAHLLNKGFRRFAFVGHKHAEWSRVRQIAFEQAISSAGHDSASYEIDFAGSRQRAPATDGSGADFFDWLRGQAKPVAVMTANDGIGRMVSRFCADLGLRVPDDAAILGVDNDDLSTAISNPPLSSVAIPWRTMGRMASQLLDRIIDGEKIEPTVQLVSPSGVVERQSTGGMAIEDEQVRTAVRFIREHAGSPITVDDVVLGTGATRRGLERKFRNILDRSPLEEIRRAHIQLGQALLSQTTMPIKQIALKSGFVNATWFTTAFREITGESPSDFRQRHHKAHNI